MGEELEIRLEGVDLVPFRKGPFKDYIKSPMDFIKECLRLIKWQIVNNSFVNEHSSKYLAASSTYKYLATIQNRYGLSKVFERSSRNSEHNIIMDYLISDIVSIIRKIYPNLEEVTFKYDLTFFGPYPETHSARVDVNGFKLGIDYLIGQMKIPSVKHEFPL